MKKILILPGHDGIPNVEQCVYFGHLASEPEACVAMTGCVGSEDVEFTIFSAHNKDSHMFKWFKEGNVQTLSRTVLLQNKPIKRNSIYTYELKLSQNKKGQKIFYLHCFLSFFYSWQLRKRNQKWCS